MGRVCLLNSTGTEVIQPASKTDIDTMSAAIAAAVSGIEQIADGNLATIAETLASAGQVSTYGTVVDLLNTVASLIGNDVVSVIEDLTAVQKPYSGVISHALTLAAGATAEPLIKAYDSGTTYTAGQVCSSSNIIYVALRETINDTPASSASDWRAVTPRAVLFSAPDTNAADVLWGSSTHQAQVLAAGGTAIKLSVDTTGLLAIYAKGTISNVVNYVIFE